MLDEGLKIEKSDRLNKYDIDRKSFVYHLRLTGKEFDKLHKYAMDSGLTISEFLRILIDNYGDNKGPIDEKSDENEQMKS